MKEVDESKTLGWTRQMPCKAYLEFGFARPEWGKTDTGKERIVGPGWLGRNDYNKLGQRTVRVCLHLWKIST